MQTNALIISFWDICLENLPVGNFRSSVLPPTDAARLIEEARGERRLSCVSGTDLLAPYHEKRKQNQVELCSVLAEHFGITLTLEDFIGSAVESYRSITPLECAKVGPHCSLLVITCAYEMSTKNGAGAEFKISSDTVRFNLIEASDALCANRKDTA